MLKVENDLRRHIIVQQKNSKIIERINGARIQFQRAAKGSLGGEPITQMEFSHPEIKECFRRISVLHGCAFEIPSGVLVSSLLKQRDSCLDRAFGGLRNSGRRVRPARTHQSVVKQQ